MRKENASGARCAAMVALPIVSAGCEPASDSVQKSPQPEPQEEASPETRVEEWIDRRPPQFYQGLEGPLRSPLTMEQWEAEGRALPVDSGQVLLAMLQAAVNHDRL